MDIINTPPYEEMQRIYSRYRNPLRKQKEQSLIGYLTDKLKSKRPDVTHYQVIRKIVGNNLEEDFIKGLAVVCSDFSYGCKDFPTFGIEDKKIPNKIKDIIFNILPF